MQLGLDVSDNSKETVIGTIPMDWDAVPFGELAIDFFSGGTPSTKEPEFWDGDIPWTTSAYIGDRLYLGQGAKFITSSGLEKSSSKLVPAGNLLIGTRVGVGKVAINLTDIAISQDLTGAIVDRTKVCPEFLAYAIRSAGVQEVIQSRTRGTTIKGIPRKDLEQVSIPLPPLDEQHRIAHVLNAIQRAIEVQDQVIAAARNLKRSLMRHLFIYGLGAEPAPSKRIQIGAIPVHWEVGTLEDVKAPGKGAIVSGPFGSNIGKRFFVESGIPVIRGNNLT
jgi:type I restriction enzyme S subunit